MSRSFRTDSDARKAKRRIRRHESGEPTLPRVVYRRPRLGDRHLLHPRFLRNLLASVPVEYVYRLTASELRAREGGVGQPAAIYRPRERVIVLYSLPEVWTFDALSESLRRSFEEFHATIVEDGTGIHVSWRSLAVAGLWFYSAVVAHELGHHRRFHFRRRNGPRGRRI